MFDGLTSSPHPAVDVTPMTIRAWSESALRCFVLSAIGLMVAGAMPVGDYAGELAAAMEADRIAEVELARAADAESVALALSECGSALSEEDSRSIAESIVAESERHGYDPLFVQALVEVESTCRPTARSPAGAVGLIQLIPSTARDVARRSGIRWRGIDGLLRPEVSLEIGLQYLAELEDRLADPYLAVAAFNLGPGRVAGMRPHHAQRLHYVRKVIGRYEGLLRAYRLTQS